MVPPHLLRTWLPRGLQAQAQTHPTWLTLTTEPHDEHHLGGDFVISEEVQQVGQREDVDGSAEQDQDLPMSTCPV